MDSLKLLIVDDEDLIRERLTKAFPFSQYGYEIVGEAANGIEALEQCANQKIDIIITDIVMPLMDGIELTEKVKDTYPHIKIILLSCHDEFRFAQKAISLGASEYLLKATAEFQDILEILDRLKLEINSNKTPSPSPLKEVPHQSIYESNERFIEDIIHIDSQISQKEFLEVLEGVDVLTESCFLQIKIQNYNSTLDSLPADTALSLKTDILKSLENLKLDQVHIYPFLWKNNNLGIIMTNPKLAFRLDSETIKSLVLEFREAVNTVHNVQIACGISKITSLAGNQNLTPILSRMLTESVLAVDSFFYQPNTDGLIFYSKTIRFTTLNSYLREKLDGLLLNALQHDDPIAIQNELKVLCSTVYDFWIRPKEVLKWLIDITKTYLSKNDMEFSDVLRKIKYVESVDDIYKYLLQLIIEQKDIVQLADYSSKNPYIQFALGYIHTHYNERIKVQDISDALFISPNYLSHIFKKEIGMGIISYLNVVRIEYAAHYLSSSKDKATVIAEKIGISDYKYFIKLFKKVKGVTPSFYRNQTDK